MLNNNKATSALRLAGWSSKPPLIWMDKFMSSTRVFNTWGKISIKLKYQGIGKFNKDEWLIFKRSHPKIASVNQAWIREVEIFVDSHSMMVARTVLSLNDCKQVWRSVNRNSIQPIGKILFADPRVKRSSFLFANKAVPFPFHQDGLLTTSLPKHWVRKSFFVRKQTPMLLTEWFLPDFIEKMQISPSQQRQIVKISMGK